MSGVDDSDDRVIAQIMMMHVMRIVFLPHRFYLWLRLLKFILGVLAPFV